MMIDFNAYIGVFPYWSNKYADVSGDGIVRLMDRDGIQRAVVLSLRAIFDDIEAGNSETFEAVARHSDRLIPAVTVSPYMPGDYKALMKEYREKGAKVLKLFPYNHGYGLMPARNEKLDEMMAYAKELGYVVSVPYRLFMNWYFNVQPNADMYAFAVKYRDIPIVIDCVNYSEYSTAVDAAEANKDVYIGTSAITMMNGIEMLTARLGANRLIGGTCAPLQIPACGTVKVTEAIISEKEKAMILGENAKALLEV
ncbi:MAG: amidohydrolase family protein [Bacillota bacterium]